MTREPKVRDLMTRDICGISEDATLLTAATAMAEQRVNSLVVWPTAAEEPFGILTSSDLIDAIAAGRELGQTKVGELSTSPLVLVTPGVRLRDAAKMMSRLNLRHLAVFNGKEVVGIVSGLDLVRALVGPPIRPGLEALTF